MTVRDRMRAWMKSERLSQDKAAERLGVSQGTISQLLTGTIACPSLVIAHGIEAATKDWSEGPILAEEWLATEPQPAPAEPSEPEAA